MPATNKRNARSTTASHAEPMVSEDTSSENQGSRPGPSRRTVVAGAAWSLPVIAAATSLPMAAATGPALTLAPTGCGFVGPSGAVPPITVQVTPGAVSQVTLQLSAGYVFSPSGLSTEVVTTDASGHASVSNIIAPSTPGGAAGSISGALASDPTVTATAALPQVVGYVYGWGWNAEGQAGNGTPGGAHSTAVPWALNEPVLMVGSTYAGHAAVTASGHVWTVGNGSYGDMANGGHSHNLTPTQAVLHGTSTPIDNVVYVHNTSNDEGTLYVRRADGTWWGSGENNSNSMAVPGVAYAGEPTYAGFRQMGLDVLAQPGNAGASVSWVQLSAIVGRSGTTTGVYTLSNGTVWTAGQGHSPHGGGIGYGTSPLTAGVHQMLTGPGTPITGIVKAEGSGQASILYLDGAGNLYYSGHDPNTNPSGYSNNGYVVSYPKPAGKQVADIIALSSWGGNGSYLARTTDGEWYAWGFNPYGRMGIGSTTNPSSWTKILLDDIVEVASGGEGMLFRQSNGDVYFAGLNDVGQVGTGTVGGAITTPQKVTSLPGPAHSIASSYWDSHAAAISVC